MALRLPSPAGQTTSVSTSAHASHMTSATVTSSHCCRHSLLYLCACVVAAEPVNNNTVSHDQHLTTLGSHTVRKSMRLFSFTFKMQFFKNNHLHFSMTSLTDNLLHKQSISNSTSTVITKERNQNKSNCKFVSVYKN